MGSWQKYAVALGLLAGLVSVGLLLDSREESPSAGSSAAPDVLQQPQGGDVKARGGEGARRGPGGEPSAAPSPDAPPAADARQQRPGPADEPPTQEPQEPSAQAQPPAQRQVDAGVRDVGSASGGDAEAPERPSGTMSREEITQTISLMGPEVKKCYEKLLEAFPEADGRITLKFTVVDSDGVGRVDLEDIDEDSSLNEKTLNECIIENLRNLEFPAPEGGDVQISYPFSFAAAKEGGP